MQKYSVKLVWNTVAPINIQLGFQGLRASSYRKQKICQQKIHQKRGAFDMGKKLMSLTENSRVQMKQKNVAGNLSAR